MDDDFKSDSTSNVESEIFGPDGERYDPLGAASDSEMEMRSFQDHRMPCNSEDIERIQDLEQEQEKLTGSLFALTSHFGQVQFRLKQIIDIGSTVSKDQWTDLLKQLEEFAFAGIPEISPDTPKLSSDESQREQQMDMIGQLKTQLQDLEKYAFEAGDLEEPQTILFEKQKIIIDELKKKMNLPIDDMRLPHLTTDELKSQVGNAVGELMNPMKMKDNLVVQLNQQIVDLERFINFIQNDEIPENFLLEKTANCDCSSVSHTKKILQRKSSKNKLGEAPAGAPAVTNLEHRFKRDDDWQRRQEQAATGLLPRMAQLFDMFTSFHLGGGGDGFRKNVLKKTARGNHWGDIRAQFEMDVDEICAHMTAATAAGRPEEMDTSQSRRHSSAILTNLVRKRMAISLRNLLQHGITKTRMSSSQSSNNNNTSTMMVPFISCFGMPRNYESNSSGYADAHQDDPSWSSVHAWDLILEYYYMQNGDKFNETPAVKLSQSFNLDLVSEACGSSVKQSLLSHIGNILSIHAPYKSSPNAHFKSFVCAALNSKTMGKWMKLICQQTTLIGAYYEPWSYMMQTGFRDSFRTIEKLSAFTFQLPVDQAVRQFESINDVFM